VTEGIYRDAFGLAATVKLGRVQREKRFPPGTSLDLIKGWRLTTRAELLAQRAEGQRTIGTLERDGQTFIARKKGTVAYKADRAHLRAWFPTFGGLLRSAITRSDVEDLLATWRTAHVAARTIRHRCRVLRECYRSLDGPDARTPVDHVSLPKLPQPAPLAVPVKTIQTVAKRLKSAGLMVDYARFVVRATTGQRPAALMRAQPSDVDLKRRIWFVRPAKGGTQIPFPLNDEMVTAWRLFAKVNAWGEFDTARAADVLREHGWPADVRPYELRHTFAIDLLLRGADLGDVQGLLGHRQIQTTRTHYAPILVARLKQATKGRKLGL
jgi:integrase